MRRFLAGLIVLALAGCSGSNQPAPEPTPEPTSQDSGPVLPEGTAVPEALSNFVCAKSDNDVWKASGVVANSDKNARDFQVTVVIGEAGAGRTKARTTQLSQIQGGESAPWKMTKLPTPQGDATCHVQVLQLK